MNPKCFDVLPGTCIICSWSLIKIRLCSFGFWKRIMAMVRIEGCGWCFGVYGSAGDGLELG